MIHSDPVIEAVDLSRLPNVVLLDVRDASISMNAKVQGAVIVPVQEWIDAARETKSSFENVAFWERQIAELDLSNEMTAVIFDDGRMTEAARVWFILQFFGAKAMVLNGGVDSARTGRTRHGSSQARAE